MFFIPKEIRKLRKDFLDAQKNGETSNVEVATIFEKYEVFLKSRFYQLSSENRLCIISGDLEILSFEYNPAHYPSAIYLDTQVFLKGEPVSLPFKVRQYLRDTIRIMQRIEEEKEMLSESKKLRITEGEGLEALTHYLARTREKEYR